MKKYYKDNQEVKKPEILIYEGKVYPNPLDGQLQSFGYAIVENKSDSPENRKIQREAGK
jgi:hypothetical protein